MPTLADWVEGRDRVRQGWEKNQVSIMLCGVRKGHQVSIMPCEVKKEQFQKEQCGKL